MPVGDKFHSPNVARLLRARRERPRGRRYTEYVMTSRRVIAFPNARDKASY